MTECRCFSKEDTVIANPPKKSPLVLKMVVLAAAMACSVCICSAFLKQIEEPSEPHIIRTDLTEVALFDVLRVNLTEKNYPRKKSMFSPHSPNFVSVNLTEKKLSPVAIHSLAEVKFSYVLRANASEITLLPEMRSNLTQEAPPVAMGVNSTEPKSHHPKPSESQLLHFDYNKTKTYSRDGNGSMPVSVYVIVSAQRSGSKWLETLLNSHDNIMSHGEIFHNVYRNYNMKVIKTVLDEAYSLNWNASKFWQKKKKCMAAVGFRWMLNQGILNNHEGIVDYFKRRGVSVILLLRRNLLRRLVSVRANIHDGMARELNGTHKAHVKSKQEAEILASYKPKLDVKRLIPALEHMERLIAVTLQNFKGTRHMVVYYEELVQNQTQTMMEVLAFLKAPQKALISKDVKIHTKPLAQQIENWRDVAKVIKRSKFRRFITATDYET